MKRLGIKIIDKTISFEAYERMEYLLDYDFEYDEMIDAIEEGKIIPLDMDEEDLEEDMEALEDMKKELDEHGVSYEIYELIETWKLISENIPNDV